MAGKSTTAEAIETHGIDVESLRAAGFPISGEAEGGEAGGGAGDGGTHAPDAGSTVVQIGGQNHTVPTALAEALVRDRHRAHTERDSDRTARAKRYA